MTGSELAACLTDTYGSEGEDLFARNHRRESDWNDDKAETVWMQIKVRELEPSNSRTFSLSKTVIANQRRVAADNSHAQSAQRNAS